jgi:hypothetical protein
MYRHVNQLNKVEHLEINRIDCLSFDFNDNNKLETNEQQVMRSSYFSDSRQLFSMVDYHRENNFEFPHWIKRRTNVDDDNQLSCQEQDMEDERMFRDLFHRVNFDRSTNVVHHNRHLYKDIYRKICTTIIVNIH